MRAGNTGPGEQQNMLFTMPLKLFRIDSFIRLDIAACQQYFRSRKVPSRK